jgi:hypothetical protein
MKKYIVFAAALLLGCLAIPVVEPVKAGSGCHGKKTPAAPVAVEVDQEVVVSPGVKVKDTVTVEEGPAGVTVVEKVEVSEGPVSGPVGVHAARKAARKAKKATIAEAKAERAAARAAKKEANAEFEVQAEATVREAYSK